jgi:hypothetical protein
MLAYVMSNTLDTQLRATALMLELFGLAIVATGLRELRKEFRRPSYRERLRGWISDFPAYKPESQILEGSAAVAGFAAASGKTNVGLPMGATIEQRLEIIEGQLHRVSQSVTDLKSDTRSRIRAISDEMSAERRARSTEIRDLGRRLELVSVGGLDLELIGMLWLVLGLVLGNLSTELGGLIGAVGIPMQRTNGV